ncbi:hypothetical protein Tco_1200914 [Tanacetum coccineum]
MLKRKANPLIKHHKAWVRATKLKKKRGEFKQRRKVVKSSKGEPSVHKDPAFDELNDDVLNEEMDYQRTEEIQGEDNTALHQSTEGQKVSTDSTKVSTDAQNVSTDIPKVSIDSTKVSTDQVEEGTDELIAKVLLNMSQARAVTREKEKGVELRDVEESDKPRPTSTRSILTLKPLPKIDPKDKGKKRIEEEDVESSSESEEITTVEKKFKQLSADEELARKVQKDWETEEERKRQADVDAVNDALVQELYDVKARLEADRLLALRLQEEEREKFTIEERAKFLHDTIAAQRRFLVEQRSTAIRSKPPTKTQLRNQMITYLKHVGGKKYTDLKNRKFDDIQTLYERVKRNNDRFLKGPLRDVQKITKKKDTQESLKEEKSDKVPAKVDMIEERTKKRKGGHIKMMARKRLRPQKDDEDDGEIKLSLMIVPDKDKEVNYEVLNKKYPIVEWKSEFHGIKPLPITSEVIEEIHMNKVVRSNGQRRYFTTLMGVLSKLDREDLNVIYQLVMNKYSSDIPEGFDRIL